MLLIAAVVDCCEAVRNSHYGSSNSSITDDAASEGGDEAWGGARVSEDWLQRVGALFLHIGRGRRIGWRR